MKHGEKIIDGILVKYICRPCPECQAKLQAGEEMAILLARLLPFIGEIRAREYIRADDYYQEIKAAFSVWEQAGKGRI